MSEQQAVVVVLWSLAVMVVVGALLPVLLPGLIQFVDRTILKEHEPKGH